VRKKIARVLFLRFYQRELTQMTKTVAKQPGRDRTRVMVAIFFFVSGFGFYTWASRIPTIQQELHLNEAQLGAVLFALPVGLMATLPVTGTIKPCKSLSYRVIFLVCAGFVPLFSAFFRLVWRTDGTWFGTLKATKYANLYCQKIVKGCPKNLLHL
jgi:hypothetical protein